MAPKKYYAVKRGRKPGIYFNWPDAKAEIDGFKGAVYKGFLTLKDAEEWLNSSASSNSSEKNIIVNSTEYGNDKVIIYTDGGSLGNPGPGGYGAVLLYNSEKKEISGGFKKTTNNRMELMAVIAALRELGHTDKPVTIYSDSSYVVNGISKGWAEKWRKNNWINHEKTFRHWSLSIFSGKKRRSWYPIRTLYCFINGCFYFISSFYYFFSFD